MSVFEFSSGVYAVLFIALLALKSWTLIDVLFRPAAAFVIADRMTRVGWLWITGLSTVTHILFPHPLSILSLLGTVACGVYLVDVRPAVASR